MDLGKTGNSLRKQKIRKSFQRLLTVCPTKKTSSSSKDVPRTLWLTLWIILKQLEIRLTGLATLLPEDNKYYSCLFLHIPIWGHIEKRKQKTSSCCFSHEPSSFLVNLTSDPVPFLCRIMNIPFIYSSSICLDPPYWKILYLYQAYLFPPTFRSPYPP